MSDNNSVIDDLAAMDDFDDAAPVARRQPDGHTRTGTVESTISQSKLARYEEPCKACRGSGTFYSYAGRPVGPCYKCKGTGVLKFKTSPEAREKARDRSEQIKRARKQAVTDKAVEWMTHPANVELAAWLNAGCERGNDFAQSLVRGLFEFGRLTVPQETALRKAVARDAARAQARDAQQAAADVAGFDLTGIPSGRYAIPREGDAPLLVKLDNVESGKWKGWVFVKGEPEGDRLGSQRPGHAYNGQHAELLQALAHDPLASAKLFGQTTGVCCICNRTLTNPESIEAGIGPICAGRFN